MCLPVFSCMASINLHIIPKMVAIVVIESSKESGPDCIPQMILQNCESEVSQIQVDLFNMYVKQLSLPDC